MSKLNPGLYSSEDHSWQTPPMITHKAPSVDMLHIVLNSEDFDKFTQTLDEPPKSLENLKKIMLNNKGIFE